MLQAVRTGEPSILISATRGMVRLIPISGLLNQPTEVLTWSAPARVNDDPPGNQQFYSWMCIDPVTGFLYFVFYDERNISAAQANVYIARSTDGGVTFQNK